MSGVQGADTDQLRDHSELLRERARSISELRERLEPTILDQSIWRGPDAEAFRSAWSSRATVLFEQTTSLLRDRGADLDTHAEEQDTASAVGDGAGSGAGGGTGPGGGEGAGEGQGTSWWDRVTGGAGVYNALQGLFSRGKKVWDLAKIIGRSTNFLSGAEDIFQLAAGTWMYGRDVVDSAFSAGTEFSGLASKLLGKLGVPTGFGNTRFFGWVDNAVGALGDTMPFLANAAPWVGKALPGLDVVFGGAQMINGIQSGDTFSAITGGAGALGGGLMLAGGALSATGVGAVVGGPLAAAGAIISGGAALADVGKMVYDNWDSISATASNAWNATTDFAGGVAEGAGNLLEGAGDAISDGWDGLTGAFGF